jgi:hypothetical protein
LGDRLVYDNFYNGEAFEVSLDLYAQELKTASLTLKISPMEESKRVYLDVPKPSVEPELKSVNLISEQRRLMVF